MNILPYSALRYCLYRISFGFLAFGPNGSVDKNFQTSEDVFKLGYEERFYDFLTDCVVEVERRIKRNKMRLDSTNGRSDSNETPVRISISEFIQSDLKSFTSHISGIC